MKASIAAALLAIAGPAWAGDGITGQGDIALGPVPGYRSEAQARAACGDDAVVWADRKTGFFYPKFFPEYGRTAHGVFTCFKAAEKADYWSLSPAAQEGQKGREFPLFFCTSCS